MSVPTLEEHIGRGEDSDQFFMKRFAIAVRRTLSLVQSAKPNGLISGNTQVIAPEAIHLSTGTVGDSIIMDWTISGKVSLQLSSVGSQTYFASDRTYVFFGLTSDLGTSLCDWFVSRGARNVVLTSRNPKIDRRWLAEMKMMGARVEVFAKFVSSPIGSL